MMNQIKGAMKLLFFFQILLAMLLVWIMKDERHISFLILGQHCQSMAVDSSQLDAFNQFQPR